MINGDVFSAHGQKWSVIEDYGDWVLASEYPLLSLNNVSYVYIVLDREKDTRIQAEEK